MKMPATKRPVFQNICKRIKKSKIPKNNKENSGRWINSQI